MVTIIQLAAVAAILAGLLLLSSASECQVSSWNPWSPCLGTCLLSMRTRNRDVLRPPFPEIRDGKLVMEPCPTLYQVQQCLIPTCPVNGTDNNLDFTHSETFNSSSVESMQQIMNHLMISSTPDVTNNHTLEKGNDTLTDTSETKQNKPLNNRELTEKLSALLENISSTVFYATTKTVNVELNSTNHEEEIKNERIHIFAPSNSPPGFAKPLPKVLLNTSTFSSLNEHESLAVENAQTVLSTAQAPLNTVFNFPFDFEENEPLTTKPHSQIPSFDLDLSVQPNEVRPQLQFVAPPSFPSSELVPIITLPPAEPPPLPSITPVDVVTVVPQQKTSIFLQNAPPTAPSVFLTHSPGNAPPAFPNQPLIIPQIKANENHESNPPLFTAAFPENAVSEPLLLPPHIQPQPPTVEPHANTPDRAIATEVTLKPGIPIVLPRPKPAPFARTSSFARQSPSLLSTPETRKNFVLKFSDVQLPKPGNFILFAGLPTKQPINRPPDFADLTLDDFVLPVPKPFPILPVPKPFPAFSLNSDDESLLTPIINVASENNKAEDDLFSEINYLDDRDVPIQRSETLLPPLPTSHVIQQQQQQQQQQQIQQIQQIQQQAKLLTWPSVMLNSTKSILDASTTSTIVNVTDSSKVFKSTSLGPKIYSRTPHLPPTFIPTTVSSLSINDFFLTGSQRETSKSVVSSEVKAVLKNESSQFKFNENVIAFNFTDENSTVNTQSDTSTYSIPSTTPALSSHSVVLLNNNLNVFDAKNISTILPNATVHQSIVSDENEKTSTIISHAVTKKDNDSFTGFQNASSLFETAPNVGNISTDILVNGTNFTAKLQTKNEENNKSINVPVDQNNSTIYEYYETTLYEDDTGPFLPNKEIINAINLTKSDSDGIFDLFSNKFNNPTSGFIPIHTLPSKNTTDAQTSTTPASITLHSFNAVTTSTSTTTTESHSSKLSRRTHGPSITVHSQLKNNELSSNQTSPSSFNESGLTSINKQPTVSSWNTSSQISTSVATESSTKSSVYNYKTTFQPPLLSTSISSSSRNLFINSDNFWRNRASDNLSSVTPSIRSSVSTRRLSNEFLLTSNNNNSAVTENLHTTISTSTASSIQNRQLYTVSNTALSVSNPTSTSATNIFKQFTASTANTELETATVKFGHKNDDNSDVSNPNPFQSNWPSLAELRHSSSTQELEPSKKIVVQSDGKEIKNVTEIIRLLNQLAGVQVTTTTEAAHYPCANNYGNKRCCRSPTRFKCPDGKPAQMVMRWYRVAGQVECSAYNYGYCGLDMELQEQPIKFEQECYNLCYSEIEKQSLPVFKEIHFDQGFRINQQNPFRKQ